MTWILQRSQLQTRTKVPRSQGENEAVGMKTDEVMCLVVVELYIKIPPSFIFHIIR